MAKNTQKSQGDKKMRKKKYFPLRYILAIGVSVVEILIILAIVVGLCLYLPFFYLLAMITQTACVIHIVSSDDNPDYKVPWLLVILALPVIGFMLYFLFYSRTLKGKYIRKINELKTKSYEYADGEILGELKGKNVVAGNQALMITKLAETHIFKDCAQEYFPSGEAVYEKLLADIKGAKTFIFMEYFIIEQGKFWNSVLEILKEKVKEGVEVKVVYDDIGCMRTLPENYLRKLKSFGIKATTFSRLKGIENNEFNNRNHRKITVIDGKIAYTGGINIADEYINEIERFGYWKDSAIRIEGEAVWEFTKLFLIDYGINVKHIPHYSYECFPQHKTNGNGYIIPFGDGPRPLYSNRVSKSVIQNMLACANEYAYITTPYLVIDNDLCQDLENTALRGVDVRIILPHIPDKKFVFEISRSFYNRMMKAGVKIYEYQPGFLHSKTYLVDDTYALLGSVNLDYRSLVHHFENAVWLYDCECVKEVKKDVLKTLEKSVLVTDNMKKVGVLRRFYRSLLRFFAPLM